MTKGDNAAICRTIYDAFDHGDFDSVLQHITANVEVTFVPTGQTFRGRDGFVEFMQGHKTAFPDIEITVTRQIESGDTVVNEFMARGSHTGPLHTPAGVVDPTGRAVSLSACEVWTFRDGKVSSIHNYQDLVSLMNQLGLLGEPSAAEAKKP
ncbi:MAG: hypothetical protein PVSMB7_25800 [Chloroflexota bacterium]